MVCEFEKELAAKIRQAEDRIAKYLPKEEGLQKTVMEAVNYSVTAGGKRLRPILLCETAKLFSGGDYGRAAGMTEPFMAAIEMIHTYSLVHDDLPAMDNDRYRRGKLTTHAAYGEAMGILAGDALLNLAFETAFETFDRADGPEDYERIATALKILGQKAGIYGMIGGQTIDIEVTGRAVEEETLSTIYRLKTGALLTASMQIGAVLAGAGKDEITVIGECAGNLGMAFQIRDDILDVTATQEELGKPVFSDEKNEKTTFVTLYGIEGAKKRVKEASDRALALYDGLKRDNPFLRSLILWLITRNK